MITTDSISIDAILNDKETEERKYLHKHINKTWQTLRSVTDFVSATGPMTLASVYSDPPLLLP